MNKKEGYIETVNGRVWYQVVGEEAATPLVVVHGGPGFPHDYLEPLEDLADQRQVIFYDQLGCGNSDKTADTSLWTVDYFVNELRKVIVSLGLEKYHLLGQSWGAALAVAFSLTQPKGLTSLILADPYISTPEWMSDAKRLMHSLPEEMRIALNSGLVNMEMYKMAKREYYARFVDRFNSVPEAVLRSGKKMSREIYSHMWGAEEYLINGTLKDFNQTSRLREVAIPVLFLCGRYDEATPEAVAHFQNLFPDARSRVFEKSAHYPHWNEREEYMQTLQSFFETTD